MSLPVSYQLQGNIGVISVNNPPVNALSQAVRQGLLDAINEAQTDASEAVVILCEGRTFIAGADITEFGKPLMDPWLPELLDIIENSSKLVVAAIHGTALGGGLETALAAHYRCAVASARIGLPEVKLGLLPGAGGTQRMPRLAGVKASLDLITSGVPISVSQGLEIGLIDKILDGDLLDAALDWTNELLAADAPIRKSSEQAVPDFDAAIFDDYRAELSRRARGQIAPGLIVTAVEAATSGTFADGMAIERDAFMTCMNSPQSAGMRHIFFAERQSAKLDDLAKDTPQRQH